MNDQVEKKRADNSNWLSKFCGCLESLETKLIQEEEWHQNLNQEHNEALFQSETLLKWRATFCHICTYRIVIDIICEKEDFIILKVLFLNDDVLSRVLKWVIIVSIGLVTTGWCFSVTGDIVILVVLVLIVDLICIGLGVFDLLVFLFLLFNLVRLFLLTFQNHRWLLVSNDLFWLHLEFAFFTVVGTSLLESLWCLGQITQIFPSLSQLSLLNLEDCEYILGDLAFYKDSLYQKWVRKWHKHDNDIHQNEQVVKWAVIELIISHHNEVSDKDHKDHEVHEDLNVCESGLIWGRFYTSLVIDLTILADLINSVGVEAVSDDVLDSQNVDHCDWCVKGWATKDTCGLEFTITLLLSPYLWEVNAHD